MKFSKQHTRNGVTYNPGDKYDGPTQSARFLYHRNIIEPDGSPGDELVTAKSFKRTAWHDKNETLDTQPTTAPTRPTQKE